MEGPAGGAGGTGGPGGHEGDVWTRRFSLTAAINALIAIGWIVPLFVDPRISRTIAGGSVGTWGVLGFLLWVAVGCLGVAGFAVMYHLTPRVTGRTLHDGLAWANLGLLEVGALVTTTLLGVAGYIGGTALLGGASPGEVHQRIAFVVEPVPTVAIFAALAALGVLLGVVNHLMAYRGGAGRLGGRS